jgi:uncharacterized protein YjdB
MPTSRSARVGALSCVLSLTLVLACGGGDGGTGNSATTGVQSVRFSQDTVFLIIGAQLATRATLVGQSGAVVSGVPVTYSAASPSIATIDELGILRGVSAGSTTITATADSRTGSFIVFVHAPVASVSLSSSTATLDVGEGRALTAELRDASGGVITAPLPVTWASSNATVASVSSRGQVTALSTGSASITATQGTRAASAFITVFRSSSATRIAIVETNYGVLLGQTRTISATAYDADNVAIPRAPTWSSSASTVASVTSSGTLTGVSPGQATLTAQLGPASGTATVHVFAGAPAGNLGAAITDDQFVLVTAGGAVAQAFRAQRTEVTQVQWQSMGLALPSGQSRTCGLCPVENVTLPLAQQFLTALNAAQPGLGYRLPTAAEWEHAARAGVTTDYHGPLELVAWFVTTRDEARSSLVGLRQPNAFGLYDVHGNVAELTTASSLPARGGSWNLPAIGMLFTPSPVLTPIVGLRLVRNP